MRNHKDDALVLVIALVIIAVFSLWFYYEVSVWRECRTDHSWFYCMRVLNK
jgi:hypothetical protein